MLLHYFGQNAGTISPPRPESHWRWFPIFPYDLPKTSGWISEIEMIYLNYQVGSSWISHGFPIFICHWHIQSIPRWDLWDRTQASLLSMGAMRQHTVDAEDVVIHLWGAVPLGISWPLLAWKTMEILGMYVDITDTRWLMISSNQWFPYCLNDYLVFHPKKWVHPSEWVHPSSFSRVQL